MGIAFTKEVFRKMWYLGYGGKNSAGYFKRREFDIENAEDVKSFFEEFKQTDIYYGTYYYTFDKTGVKHLYGDFYLDFDSNLTDNTAYHNLKMDVMTIVSTLCEDFYLKPENMQFYFSGSKGFHLIIPAENLGICAMPNLNATYKLLAKKYQEIAPSIDTQIYDDRRIFRCPNSINSKTGLFKIQLSYSELKQIDFKTLCHKATQAQPLVYATPIDEAHAAENFRKLLRITDRYNFETDKKHHRAMKHKTKKYLNQQCLAPCMLNILEEQHHEGHRNNILVVLASSFFQLGCTYEEVLDYLMDWTSTHFAPNLEINEVERTIQSAFHQVENRICFGCTRISELGFCTGNCQFVLSEERDE